MIKIRVQLDGNEQGYLTYTFKETMEEYREYVSDSSTLLIGLTEVDTNSLVTIPLRRYVVEAWEVDE